MQYDSSCVGVECGPKGKKINIVLFSSCPPIQFPFFEVEVGKMKPIPKDRGFGFEREAVDSRQLVHATGDGGSKSRTNINRAQCSRQRCR